MLLAWSIAIAVFRRQARARGLRESASAVSVPPFMPDQAQRIARAWLRSASVGIIELNADWTGESLPLLAPGDKAFAFADLGPAAPSLYADESGYYVDEIGMLVFVLDPEEHSWVDFSVMPVYVAGTFNGWQDAIGQLEWSLVP